MMAEAIAAGLRHEAIAVDVVDNGADALERAGVNAYDVVVLDRDIPVVHGDDVCRALVEGRAECRIVMLTAARGRQDTVEGLNLGADDYLTKPFHFAELVARIRALHRRGPSVLPPVLEHAGIQLDPYRREVRRGGALIALTRKEFAVLEILMAARGGVTSAERLLEKAWDENADPFTGIIKVTIWSLRRKLGEPKVIHTEVGVGYRLASS